MIIPEDRKLVPSWYIHAIESPGISPVRAHTTHILSVDMTAQPRNFCSQTSSWCRPHQDCPALTRILHRGRSLSWWTI